ncbi:YnfC family lipoprotein [Providencia rettgeri]
MNIIKLVFLLLLSIHYSQVAYADNTKIGYSKKMINYSIIFGFDPLYGNVKDTLQVLKDESGKTIKYVKASFDDKGCINSIISLDGLNSISFSFERDGKDIYAGINSKKLKVYDIDNNCNIIKSVSKGSEFLYKNNLIYSMTYDGDNLTTIHYDKNEIPIEIKIKTLDENTTEKMSYTFKNKEMVNSSFESINNITKSTKLVADINCRIFDDKNNPLKCDYDIPQENGTIIKNKLIYKNTYY